MRLGKNKVTEPEISNTEEKKKNPFSMVFVAF